MFIDIVARSLTVGYAQSGLKYGGTLAAPQFLNIGVNTATPISSLTPTGEDTYNNIAVSILDAYGYTESSYTWTDAGGEGWDTIGWVDDDNNIVSDISFAPGTALWISGTASTQGLQSAGAVGKNDVVVQLRYGGTQAGNPFPVDTTLGALLPTGDDTYNNISVQILDAYGYSQASYTWTDAGGEGWDTIGWVDDDNNLVTDVVISAGQGLWISGSNDAQYITFPAPEL